MFLEVDGVSKFFEIQREGALVRIPVIDNLSFELEEGAFVSVIGPTGCGKSTLLRILDGLQHPDVGEVRIRGKAVTGPGPDRGMVFQNHNLWPWRTVVRNVEFGLEMLGVSRQERRKRALSLLETVGLSDFSDAYPSQLSGGMQQRVGLARALVLDPDLLLMDEPFGSLDAQTKVLLQEELERLCDRLHNTVVFVTHDIEEALYLSDRILVMGYRPGRILEDIQVPFAQPRESDLRATPEFAKLKQHVWHSLQRGSIQEGASARQVSRQ